MCRSPLPNRIQPSATLCRVGRSPTSRSMDFTSCHGQPVSWERALLSAQAPGGSLDLLKTTECDGVIGTPEPYSSHPRAIVAFVTYCFRDATPSANAGSIPI